MKESMIDIMDEGITCLRENLGIMKMELFISTIQREKFDYTKWHQRFVDTMSKREFDQLCEKSARENPYAGNPDAVL